MSLPFDLRMFAAPAIVAVATLTTPVAAQEESLKVGSVAPALTLDWLQGNVADFSDMSKTYVVEFWATWCGPCRESIPHLNSLYKKHRSKGLVVMGISNESAEKVRPFVTKQGAAMSYPVAIDKEEQTKRAWLDAAKQEGIPCAFIVRSGRIVWIGHPLDPEMEKVLVGTMTGRYNPELSKKSEPILKAAKDAIRIKNFQDAYEHFDTLIQTSPTFFGDVAVLKYKTMLVDAKDPEGAAKWGSHITARWILDPLTLRELTETILNDSAISPRDYQLALTSAKVLDANHPSAAAKALVAEVYARQGDFAKASEAQYEAWMKAESFEKPDYKRLLDSYKKSLAKAGAKPAAPSASKAAEASGGEASEGDAAPGK